MGSAVKQASMAQHVPFSLGHHAQRAVLSTGFLFVTLTAPLWAGSVTYSYDSLGRLTDANYSNGVAIAYTYDASGSRTAMVVTGAAADATALKTTAAPLAVTPAVASSPAAIGPTIVDLNAAGEDPGVYGWNDLSDNPAQSVSAVYNGEGVERLLHVQGYAINAPGMVGLWLNGSLLGYLSPASDGSWSTPSLWLLPAALEQPGENLIELRPSAPDIPWGVARLGLYPFGRAWGNQEGLRDGDLTHPDGVELHLFSQNPRADAGRLVELAGWDVDSDDEISISLNGKPFVNVPTGADAAWGATYHLWLDPAAMVNGDNRLLIGEQFGPLEPWGLRLDRVKAGSSALGNGVPGQPATDRRPDGVRLLLPPAAGDALYAVRFFDVTNSRELTVRLDGILQGSVAITGAQAWGAPHVLVLPPGIPTVLSIDRNSLSDAPNVWGVGIDLPQ